MGTRGDERRSSTARDRCRSEQGSRPLHGGTQRGGAQERPSRQHSATSSPACGDKLEDRRLDLGMDMVICQSTEEAARHAAQVVVELLAVRPEACSRPRPDTPRPVYAGLVRLHAAGAVSFARRRCSISTSTSAAAWPPASFRHSCSETDSSTSICRPHAHAPIGDGERPSAAAAAYERAIADAAESIRAAWDRRNGHIAFNEPARLRFANPRHPQRSDPRRDGLAPAPSRCRSRPSPSASRRCWRRAGTSPRHRRRKGRGSRAGLPSGVTQQGPARPSSSIPTSRRSSTGPRLRA